MDTPVNHAPDYDKAPSGELKLFDALPPSMQKIIEATLAVVSRRGTRKLSMADIADAAGLSRATLYRYFATKDELLNAVSEYNSRAFEETVVEIGQNAAPAHCLQDVLDYHFSKTSALALNDLITVEPMFTIDFLRQHFERHVAAMKEALKPSLDMLERELGAAVDRDLLAEAFIRIQLSTVLVPAQAKWLDFPAELVEILRQFHKRSQTDLALVEK